jgi:hypothetical protein
MSAPINHSSEESEPRSWLRQVFYADVSAQEIEAAADLVWILEGNSGPRPGRPIVRAEGFDSFGGGTFDGSGSGGTWRDDKPLAPVGGDGGGAGKAAEGTQPGDITVAGFGQCRMICCFAKASMLEYKAGPTSFGGTPSPAQPTVVHFRFECWLVNGKGAQQMLDNMKKCLELMQATAIYKNQVED